MPFGIGKKMIDLNMRASRTNLGGGGGGTQPDSANLFAEWRADRVKTVPGYTPGVVAVSRMKNQVHGPDLVVPTVGGDNFQINPSGSHASLNTGPYVSIPIGSPFGNYEYSIVTVTSATPVFSANAVGASITISGASTAAQNGTWTIQTVPSSTQVTFFNYNIIAPSPFSGPDGNNGAISYSVTRLVGPQLVSGLANGWAYGVGGFGNQPYNFPLVINPIPGFGTISGGNALISGTNNSLTTEYPLTGLVQQITVYFLWSTPQGSGFTANNGGGGGPGQITLTNSSTNSQIELSSYYFNSAAGPIPYNFVTFGTPPPALPGLPNGFPNTPPYSAGRTSYANDPFTPGNNGGGQGDIYNLAAFSVDTSAPSIPSPNFLNVDDVYGYFTPPNGSPYPPQLRIYGHPFGAAGGGSFGTQPGAGNGPATSYSSLTVNIGVTNIDAPVTTPFRLSQSFLGFGPAFDYWWSGGYNSNGANAGLNITHIMIYNTIHSQSDFTNVYNYLNNIWGGITG